jgi:nucleoside-diphosphate-sugar epimerase
MKRIVFTGGTGKAGKWAVQHLIEHGYQVLNLDTKPLDNPNVRTLITDITDAGQVYNALSSYTGVHEYDPSLKPQPIDAVVHFAAIPRILIVPDGEQFRINVMGTYNVIEAAVTLGIKKIIVASSETIHGIIFANYERDPAYLPLDEEYPVDPPDSYALSKLINENTARAFVTRMEGKVDIYCLRIGNVIEPHEYARFPSFFKDPGGRKRLTWSYVDARDLGEISRLCIEKDGLGFQVFNATSDDNSSDLPTPELLKRFYPKVPVKGAVGQWDALLSPKKSHRLLGYKQLHHWRDYVTGYERK